MSKSSFIKLNINHLYSLANITTKIQHQFYSNCFYIWFFNKFPVNKKWSNNYDQSKCGLKFKLNRKSMSFLLKKKKLIRNIWKTNWTVRMAKENFHLWFLCKHLRRVTENLNSVFHDHHRLTRSELWIDLKGRKILFKTHSATKLSWILLGFMIIPLMKSSFSCDLMQGI